jgi:membrane protein DedA with SNARE-associated domain
MSDIFIWSLGSSLAAGLLATLNIVGSGRPDDKTLAVITATGTTCWAALAFSFGISIGNVFDPRPLGHVIISVALVIFSALTLWKPSEQGAAAFGTDQRSKAST